MRDLKSWTIHTLHPSGTVIVDSGAHTVLSRRESGGRLLPAGVIGVVGDFASGQAVRIAVLKHSTSHAPEKRSSKGFFWPDGTDSPGPTRPGTPGLVAIASVTSSVTSLEPLSSLGSSLSKETTMSPVEIEDVTITTKQENEAPLEYVEVGRGLANYNSAQILKIKGLKRSAFICVFYPSIDKYLRTYQFLYTSNSRLR
jgi:glutamate 5-kinase